MAKIETLTPEQESMISVYRDIGIQIGLATGPTARETVIPEFVKLYEQILEKPAPKTFIFVKSPQEAQKVMSVLTTDKDDTHSSWTLETNDEFVSKTLSRFKKYNGFQDTHSFGMGSCESFWTQFYLYFRDVVGIDFSGDPKSNIGLNIFSNLAKNSGWHYLFDECVVICDRPESIVMENNQLHNEEGPAIAYTDGYKLWFIRGHQVNEKIVMAPQTLTVKEIKKESNNEMKRIMIERFGVSEYLAQTKAAVLDKDQLGLEGSAPRVLLEDSEGFRWLMCSDGSTGRVYFLPAPNDAKTCREAHEAISGISESNIIGEC